MAFPPPPLPPGFYRDPARELSTALTATKSLFQSIEQLVERSGKLARVDRILAIASKLAGEEAVEGKGFVSKRRAEGVRQAILPFPDPQSR